MTDPSGRGPGQGEPYPYGSAGYPDPAYGAQLGAGQQYQVPGDPNPTRQLPASEYGYNPYDPYATGSYDQSPQPDYVPEPPSRRWLWILASASVLTVLGLIVAVVIVDSSSQQTVVAPPPTLRTSTTPVPPVPSTPATTSSLPRPSTSSLPTTLPPLVPTTASGPTRTVSYDVSGTGRAISITYVDAGGVLQTEFNVMLPWSKQVELADADTMASVNIINFGREVTCSISVDGAQVESNTGAGLTICGALR